MAQIQNKKLILFLILGILVIVGALLIYNYYLKPKEKLENKIETKEAEKTVSLPSPPKVEVTQPGINKILEAFPKDIIQEKDAQILQSYEANIEGGEKQYIIRYLSQETSPTNIIKYYKKYLLNNGWGIEGNILISGEIAKISALKGTDRIIIISSLNNKQNIVDITLIRRNNIIEIKKNR